jgi:DnaK suppressor protein
VEPAKIAPFRALLERMRDDLVRAGDIQLESEKGEDVVKKPDDDAAPLAEMAQVIASNRNRSRTEQLAAIVLALRRLEEDPEDFGMCEQCEEAIPDRRLELMPWTRLCIGCQGEREADGPASGRKHTTDYR